MFEMMMIVVSVAVVVLGPQIWAIRAWQGVWRWLAAVPLVLVGADLVLILVSTAVDPTSHNLWPLELLFVTVIGLPVVGLLWLVRLVAKA